LLSTRLQRRRVCVTDSRDAMLGAIPSSIVEATKRTNSSGIPPLAIELSAPSLRHVDCFRLRQ
jgi:hypothetical protein